MRISFTGTQTGMTASQKRQLETMLTELKPIAFIHGGCIGADDEADAIAAQLGIARFVFPSDIAEKSVPHTILKAREGSQIVVMPEKPPLERNPDIVRAGDVLIAAPRQLNEVRRSGTWATIRHARKRGVKVQVLNP